MEPVQRFGRAAAGVVAAAVVLAACSWEGDVGTRVARAAAAQSSTILAADGSVLTTLHAEQDREVVPLERIAPVLRDAVVAVEDRRFWQHAGVDVRAMLRAALANAEEGRVGQGGSTITQQYVKNALLSSDRTVRRKLEEASLAVRLEREFSKEAILEGYLNTIYFGNGAYGAQAAARVYFGVDAAALSLPQAALLAGLIRSPAAYDPYRHPAAARARRDTVLDLLAAQHLVTGAAVAAAKASPLGVSAAPREARYPAPHFVEAVKRFVLAEPAFGRTRGEREQALFTGGLRIHTTLDPAEQRAAEDAIAKVLSQPARDPEAALVALDPRSGEVRALVGGRDFFGTAPHARFDLATQGGRPGGSSFKPFVLAAALTQGIPLSRTYPAPATLRLPQRRGPDWVVDNYEGQGHGRMNLVDATVESVNTVYAQLVTDVGPEAAVATARRLGVASPLQAVPAAVLGANDVTPLDMATAYATFAARGVRTDPAFVTRVTGPDGRVLYERRRHRQRTLPRDVADTVNAVLQQVVSRGTGVNASIGRPVAGKTGTGQQWRDAWFVGYTPELVAAVWVGFPQAQVSMVPPATRIRVTGGSWPAQIWQLFASQALAGTPITPFPAPAPPTTTTLRRVEVAVPDVVALSYERAEAALREAGFAVARTDRPNAEYPPGIVVGQDPGPGQRALTGTTVELVVSTGSAGAVHVPDVLGMTRAEAEAALTAVGLRAAVTVEAEPPSPGAAARGGRVWRQNPVAGTLVNDGDAVAVSVNPGG